MCVLYTQGQLFCLGNANYVYNIHNVWLYHFMVILVLININRYNNAPTIGSNTFDYKNSDFQFNVLSHEEKGAFIVK